MFVYVCLYVRNTITCESLESSLLVCGYSLRGYASSSYMKVIGSRSRSREQKARKAQCKTSIGNNSGSIEDRAVKFACIVGVSATAKRMV